jgi:hypothetical protein
MLIGSWPDIICMFSARGNLYNADLMKVNFPSVFTVANCLDIPLFFFKSCAANPSLNFLILTDATDEDLNDISNVTNVQFNLADFNALATEKLGIQIALLNGFKVCDLRPAYGVIFQEYIIGHEYWGFRDFDIILGDTEPFLRNVYQDEIDVFSTKQEWNSGSFSMYKNYQRVNSLFSQTNHWKHIFTNMDYFGFDECGQRWGKKPIKDQFSKIPLSIYDIISFDANEDLKVSYNDFVLEWTEDLKLVHRQDGKWFNSLNNREYMYVHLLLMKNNWRFYIPKNIELSKEIFMTGMGMSACSQSFGLKYLWWLLARIYYRVPVLIQYSLQRSIGHTIKRVISRYSQ